jgi:phosphoglycolate phosphatase-like HAD superfamily hydrolase
MLTKEYVTISLNGEEAYVKVSSLSQLKEVEAIVFDCDGVLIDIKDSYNKAISKTVAYIMESLTGHSVPDNLISEELLFLFRKSGGFNNDWDTVYGILMFILCNLPKKIRDKLEKLVEEALWQPDISKRLSLVKENVNKEFKINELNEQVLKEIVEQMKQFTYFLDSTGVESVDKKLLENSNNVKFFNTLKCFLHNPPEVGKSIIATVFEEFFEGSNLFKETYGFEPRFYKGLGLIENEKSIIIPETLDRLAAILGKPNFGIASGSRFKPAEHILVNLLIHFKRDALIFLDYIQRAQDEHFRKGFNVNLRKPSPFSLFKCTEALSPLKFVLYVGDSAEDIMMVTEARKTDPRFLFAGVYRFSSLDEALLDSFLKYGCDLVLPTVNELPLVLEAVRRMEK